MSLIALPILVYKINNNYSIINIFLRGDFIKSKKKSPRKKWTSLSLGPWLGFKHQFFPIILFAMKFVSILFQLCFKKIQDKDNDLHEKLYRSTLSTTGSRNHSLVPKNEKVTSIYILLYDMSHILVQGLYHNRWISDENSGGFSAIFLRKRPIQYARRNIYMESEWLPNPVDRMGQCSRVSSDSANCTKMDLSK